jgi:hypothetical protein
MRAVQADKNQGTIDAFCIKTENGAPCAPVRVSACELQNGETERGVLLAAILK